MTATANHDPESSDGPCPVCGEPAAVGAPCERCGRLEWFTWEVADGVPILRPTGHLLHAEPIQKFIDAYDPSPESKLILDLSRAQYISSAALSKLLSLRKRLLSRKSRLVLRSVHPDLWEVLRVTRLDTYFEIEG